MHHATTCHPTARARAGVLFLLLVLSVLVGAARAGDLPFTTAWTAAPDLQTYVGLGREIRCGGLLPDGRLLFLAAPAGDYNYRILIFDPNANTWQWKAQLPVRDYTGYMKSFFVLPLASGQCLVTGWNSATYDPLPMETYLYDPATDAFTRKADMALPYTSTVGSCSIWPGSGYVTELPTGEILVGGADSLIYNPATDVWRYGPSAMGGSKRTDPVLRLACGGLWFQVTQTVDHVTYYGAGRFDAGTMQWRATVAPTTDQPSFTTYSGAKMRTLVDAEVFALGRLDLWKYDLYTDAYSFVDTVPSDVTQHDLFTLNAAGRGWLGWTYTATNPNDYGYFDVRIRDAGSATWANLARGPVRILDPAGQQADNRALACPLANGVLLLGYNQGVGLVKAQFLLVTSGGGGSAPAVDPLALPTALNLDEGTTTTLGYRLIGDFPTGGVEVVVERLSGDGDVRVLNGFRQTVRSRSETHTVTIAALIDADAADDHTTVRLRVVQPGGGDDPNARTIPVTVKDLYRSATHQPGDVNGDGVVNAADLDEVVRNFSTTAPGN